MTDSPLAVGGSVDAAPGDRVVSCCSFDRSTERATSNWQEGLSVCTSATGAGWGLDGGACFAKHRTHCDTRAAGSRQRDPGKKYFRALSHSADLNRRSFAGACEAGNTPRLGSQGDYVAGGAGSRQSGLRHCSLALARTRCGTGIHLGWFSPDSKTGGLAGFFLEVRVL